MQVEFLYSRSDTRADFIEYHGPTYKLTDISVNKYTIFSDLPFELMILDDNNVFCNNYQVTRIPLTPLRFLLDYYNHYAIEPAFSIILSSNEEILLINSIPENDPLIAEYEIFEETCKDIGLDLTFISVDDSKEFISYINKNNPPILIYFGHAAYDVENDKGYLQFKNDRLSFEQLDEIEKFPSFVCLIGCETASSAAFSGGLSNYFLKNGTRAVLATLFPIPADHAGSFIGRLLNLSTIFIAKHADAVIATGTQSYEFHLSIGVSKEKMFTYPQCAIDYTGTSDKDTIKEIELENKKIILYLSRVVPYKGLDCLIKAFALLEKKMDDVCLLIAGDGYFRGECEDLIIKLDVKNAFLIGSVDDVTKATCYETCDVFVLPTIFLNGVECWGLVINEAMAFSKPIITTDAVGAVKDMVHDGYNGYVVRNKNAQELCGALYEILSSPESAKLMGKNSRKIFEEKNDYGKMTSKFMDAIEHIKKVK